MCVVMNFCFSILYIIYIYKEAASFKLFFPGIMWLDNI